MAVLKDRIERKLAQLTQSQLLGIGRGVEKESLRSLPDGGLALTPHPAALGSPLTHPSVTTDFCESQIELITAVHHSVEDVISELTELHQLTHRAIGDELLWGASMPCGLPADETIPLARYGRSNEGRLKCVYRMGLGHRYGRRMQTISGIHYNWSMPGLSSDDYFALARNFQRHSFLLLYLFGASPAVCSSFISGRVHGLTELARHTWGHPSATTLRMGRLGYQSDAQASLNISFNDLQTYLRCLREAIATPYPAYEAVGIQSPGGEYNQLSTSVLQIENEFYCSIRPKRSVARGERPLAALGRQGVEYIEVRCIDLDPFEPIGLAANTLYLIDVFMLHCLLSDSPPDDPCGLAAVGRNQERTATSGRTADLRLERDGREVTLRAWAKGLLDEFAPIADRLDQAQGTQAHATALAAAMGAIGNPDLLPSARMVGALGEGAESSYVQLVRRQSTQAKQWLLELPWTAEQAARWKRVAEGSFEAQRALESSSMLPFETYRRSYLGSD